MKALAFLAADDETIGRFLAASGIYPQDLRERLADPGLLAAVLDFVLTEDKLLLGFAESEAIDPKLVHAARRALPGATPDL